MTEFQLEEQTDCTVDHNDIVPVLLGLSKILDDIAERATVEADGRSGGQRAAPEPLDEELVLAVLGLFSLRQTLRRRLRQCPSSSLPPEDTHFDRGTLEANLLR